MHLMSTYRDLSSDRKLLSTLDCYVQFYGDPQVGIPAVTTEHCLVGTVVLNDCDADYWFPRLLASYKLNALYRNDCDPELSTSRTTRYFMETSTTCEVPGSGVVQICLFRKLELQPKYDMAHPREIMLSGSRGLAEIERVRAGAG